MRKRLLTLGMLLLLAGCAPTPAAAPVAPPPTPAPLPTPAAPVAAPPTGTPPGVRPQDGSGGGVIAFVSDRGGSQDLYLMDADGSDLRQLTSGPGNDGWATWSPDGRQIAYHSVEGGRGTLRIVDVATGTSERLAVGLSGSCWEPAWSHDGRWIAFSNQPAGGSSDIYLVRPDGTGRIRLTDHAGTDGVPVWSPDDRQIAFLSERDGNFEVYLMDADGANQRRLTEDPGQDIVTAWSPDGAYLAFFSNREGRYQLYRIRPDGSELSRLVDSPAEDSYPSYSPSGTRMAYSSGRGDDLDVYVMDADGTGVLRLTDRPGADLAPVWRPEGEASGSAPDSVWVRPADGAAMVYVPAGEYTVGSDYLAVREARKLCQQYGDGASIATCGQAAFADEGPAHPVALGAFYLDRTEVTNGQYRRCMQAGACTAPAESGSFARDRYYGDSAYDGYPVIWVTQPQAAAYCHWAGARLPTEAEWEAAARGPAASTFPWGDTFDGGRLNYCDAQCSAGPNDPATDDGYADTAPVGSFPDGASWCGALDMAGNVREWVSDWYGRYPSERQVDPAGPLTGDTYTTRGGSWLDRPDDVRSANRGGNSLDYAHPKVGFRCAADAAGP